MFSLAYLITSCFIGSKLKYIGRKVSILIGYTLIIFSTVSFGLFAYIKNDNLFFAMSLILRFVQGFGDSFIYTSCYSILTFEFPEDRAKFIGYGEMAAGVGLMTGPVLGALVYSALGYQGTFYFFSCLAIIVALIDIYLMPWRVNH